jgi:hypothetical protein
VIDKRVWFLFGSLFGVVVLATVAMGWVRQSLVEPQSVALACAATNEGWRCALREWAVTGFQSNTFGLTSLLAGAIATVLRWRIIALVAIVPGIAGAMLYTFELSGMGLLLGALVWVNRGAGAPLADQHGAG